MTRQLPKEPLSELANSPALWNRTRLDLTSNEVLAQILDRGTMNDWRALYRLAREDEPLRKRMLEIILQVPLPLPRFWLAAMASLGEEVDWDVELASYSDQGT